MDVDQFKKLSTKDDKLSVSWILLMESCLKPFLTIVRKKSHTSSKLESKKASFHLTLSLANLSPCFKAENLTLKKNFQLISVLSCLSKIYERVMYTQMLSFMKDKLSHLLCGFREKYSTQHALIRLLKACRKCLDNKGIMGMVLMDLSKTYDCFPHDLLLVKPASFGFGTSSLNLLHSYLSNRK